MIQVDDRIGSSQLFSMFTRGRAVIKRLDSADFAFDGIDRDGTPVVVGIERKTVQEVMNDWDRFTSTQLPKFIADWNYTYVIVEGSIRPVMNGTTCEMWYHGSWRTDLPGMQQRWGTFVNKLHTLRRLFGTTCIQSATEWETVQTVQSLEDWWRKEWEEHKSYKTNWIEPPPYVMPRRPSPYENMLASIPDIGWKTIGNIVAKFPSMESLLNADQEALQRVTNVGKERAKQIYNVLRRNYGTKGGKV